MLGTLSAQQIHTTYTTSSVLYQSGSTKFGDTVDDTHQFTGSVDVSSNIVGRANVQANKFIFTDGVVSETTTTQKVIGTSGNILYLYTGASGLYINNQANNAQNVTITDAGVVTTRGGVQIGSSGNDQNLTFGGTNSSIYWGTGGTARMYYNVGDIKISSAGATDVLTVKNIGGVEISGGITGSLMATNGVVSGSVQLPEIAGIEAYTASLKSAAIVSSSQQIQNYNTFAVTSSANTFYGNQTVIGSLGVGVVPTQKLHIAGASNNVFLNEATSGNYAINRLKNGSFTVDSGVDSSGMYLDGATGDFRYYSGSIERFRIGNDGKKYLGVYNGSRLQVDATGESVYSYTNNYYIYGLYNDSNSLSIESAFAGNIIFRTAAQGISSVPQTATEKVRISAAGDLQLSYGLIGSQTSATSGYVNETQTITAFTTSYFLNKSTGTNNGSSATTFNLTGLPATNGTIIDVVLIVEKDATVGAINTSAIFNINGSDPGISTVFASGTSAVTTIKTFRVGRFNGTWRIVGAVGTY